ncbi:hypothetical protein NDU88_003111 [Pleurodeles waltl]|uniref:Uncharacterized protein n=1 Tax=Pleurodeles waltl TaxID=8319 RepID=A0AAV7V0D6_PLEWA|nr:hypothetical protein NDU88_003111 [Pleurodeles waltl]
MGASVLGAGEVRSKKRGPDLCQQRGAADQMGGPRLTPARGAEVHLRPSDATATQPRGGLPWSFQARRTLGCSPPPLTAASGSPTGPNARGPGAEAGLSPGQPAHQPQTRSPLGQASDVTPVQEAVPEPQSGTPLRVMILGSWSKGRPS